jgi:thioredoxin-related protein
MKSLDIQRLPAVIFFDEKGRQVLKTDSVLRQKRMLYSCKYVLDNAYDKGWTYQRYGRFQEIQKKQAALKKAESVKLEKSQATVLVTDAP